MSAVRIPPVLRTSTGCQKHVTRNQRSNAAATHHRASGRSSGRQPSQAPATRATSTVTATATSEPNTSTGPKAVWAW